MNQEQVVSYLRKPLMTDAKECLQCKSFPILSIRLLNDKRYAIMDYTYESKKVSYAVLSKNAPFYKFGKYFTMFKGELGETINEKEFYEEFKDKVRWIIFFYPENIKISPKYIMPKVLLAQLESGCAFTYENRSDDGKRQITFPLKNTFDVIINNKPLRKIQPPKRIIPKEVPSIFNKRRKVRSFLLTLSREERDMCGRKIELDMLISKTHISKEAQKSLNNLANMIALPFYERKQLKRDNFKIFEKLRSDAI